MSSPNFLTISLLVHRKKTLTSRLGDLCFHLIISDIQSESKTESVFRFRLRRFDYHWIVSLYAFDYNLDYDSVTNEYMPVVCAK